MGEVADAGDEGVVLRSGAPVGVAAKGFPEFLELIAVRFRGV